MAQMGWRLKSAQALLSSEFVFREQYAYGHKEILCEYAGLPSDCVLLGRIQHGWDPFEQEPSRPFRPPLRRESWQWLWSDRSLRLASERGVKKVQAIGAPWLYLRAQTPDDPTNRQGIIAMPGHRNEAASEELHDGFACTLLSEYSGEPIVVVLHGLDFITKRIRDVYLDRGLALECAGWPVIPHTPRTPSSEIGDRVNFLPNLMSLMSGRQTLVTDSMGTHVLYAGSMKLDVVIWPHPNEGASEGDNLRHRTGSLLRTLEMESRWRQRNLATFYCREIPTSVIQDLVERYLGTESFRSPSVLASMLRWETPKDHPGC